MISQGQPCCAALRCVSGRGRVFVACDARGRGGWASNAGTLTGVSTIGSAIDHQAGETHGRDGRDREEMRVETSGSEAGVETRDGGLECGWTPLRALPCVWGWLHRQTLRFAMVTGGGKRPRRPLARTRHGAKAVRSHSLLPPQAHSSPPSRGLATCSNPRGLFCVFWCLSCAMMCVPMFSEQTG
ncbi:hypothetical protein LZ30DRAFT_701061 [Colletotrichum cereale]|nr:hypothetical protein LZ30DRAFT_701061 [Colletotrichum cereale]